MRLSERSGKIESFHVRKILEMLDKRRHDPSIISFGGGAASLAPPQEMIHSLFSKLKNNPRKYSTYTPSQGIYTLRWKIAKNLRKYGVKISPEQVVMTDGGTEALFLAFSALFNPGDHVLIQDPGYFNYENPLRFLGVKAKYFRTRMKDNYQISEGELKRRLTKKTKGIVVVSPNNPAGTLLTKASIKTLARFAKKHKLWIVCDEAYRSVVFEGCYEDIYRYAPKNCVNLTTFSKSASSPGLRLGYIYGPKDAIERMVRVKELTSLCSNSWSQTAVQEFFKIKDSYKANVLIPTYKRRRNAMAVALAKYLPKAKWIMPQGGFYIYADFSSYRKGKNDVSAAEKLFKKEKVVVVPGSCFGPSGKGHLRLTFVSEEVGQIEEGIRRIARFFR